MRFSLPLLSVVFLSGCGSSSITSAPRPNASESSYCPTQTSTKVQLFGEFERPGPLPFEPGLTVYAAIQKGGGLRDIARRDKLRILRCGQVVGPFLAPDTPGAHGDLPLMPGDVLDSPFESL